MFKNILEEAVLFKMQLRVQKKCGSSATRKVAENAQIPRKEERKKEKEMEGKGKKGTEVKEGKESKRKKG